MSDTEAVERFKRAFGLGGTAAAADAEATPLAEGYLRSSVGWRTANKTIRNQVAELRKVLRDVYEPGGNADAVLARFDAKMAAFLAMFDGTIVEQLVAIGEAQDRAEQDKLARSTRSLLAGYRQLLGNKVLADIDDNPFTPLTIRTVLSTALSSLPKELEAA